MNIELDADDYVEPDDSDDEFWDSVGVFEVEEALNIADCKTEELLMRARDWSHVADISWEASHDKGRTKEYRTVVFMSVFLETREEHFFDRFRQGVYTHTPKEESFQTIRATELSNVVAKRLRGTEMGNALSDILTELSESGSLYMKVERYDNGSLSLYFINEIDRYSEEMEH